MNSNPNSKRLLLLMLLGACLAGGGFFAYHVLQRKSDSNQERAYQMEVMADLQPVAAKPWQDGTNDFPDSQTAPAPILEKQVDASGFLQAVQGEMTVAASSSLQAAVTQEFEAKQKLQEAQVQLLEQRVRELRRILEYRNANRRKIISTRVRELSGIEADSFGKVQQPPISSTLQLTSPKSGNAAIQVAPQIGSLYANPTPYSTSVSQPYQQTTVPELRPEPTVQTSDLLGSLAPQVRSAEQTDGISYENREAVDGAAVVADVDRANLLADRATLLGAIGVAPEVSAPVREIDFGPQNQFMRAVALGMFRGEKGVFLSADEETFVMQASPSQHERFAAVAHEIFTSPYVSPDRLGAHIRDLQFKSKRMRTLLDSKEGVSPFAKEGRRKLEESLRRNEDLIAAFTAIVENENRGGDTEEEVAVPPGLPVDETTEAEAVFEEPDGFSEPATEATEENHAAAEEPAAEPAAEPAVEAGDLPKEFSRGAETEPAKSTTEEAADGFGMNTESR